MKSKHRLLLIVSAIAVILIGLVLWHSLRHKQLYKVTILPSLGYRQTLPEAINDHEQVAGIIDLAAGGTISLFIWDRDNGLRDLGISTVGIAYIDNAGQVAATTTDPNGSKQAFLWDPNDGITMLGTLDGAESFASALNNRGQVVGFSKNIRDQQAFIWDKAGGMRNITPKGRPYAMATAINDSGQILGEIWAGYDLNRPKWSPFYWDLNDPNVTLTETDISPKDNPLKLEAINSNGYVLAITRRRSEGMHWVCLWHKETGLKRLFPREDFSGLVAFNDSNQVLYIDRHLGMFRDLTRKYFPHYGTYCLWDPKRGKLVLNNQVPRKFGKLVHVTDINNQGCIVGWVRQERPGRLKGVLLEPIPERWDK